MNLQAKRTAHITVDVETLYPHQFTTGTELYNSDGFLIGVITDTVVVEEGDGDE